MRGKANVYRILRKSYIMAIKNRSNIKVLDYQYENGVMTLIIEMV